MANIQFLKYQEEAADHVIPDLKEHGRSLLVMATGTGKTHTALGILEQFLTSYPNKRVLILSHRKEILDQWETRISEVFEQEVNFFSSKKKVTGKAQFYACSFQLTWKLVEQNKFPTSYFDYVIVDEAHHAQASTFKQVLEQLRYQWILGLTATPDRLDGADIRSIFGKESFTYDLATAIADGALTPATIKIRSCQITEDVLEQIRTEAREDNISRSELERRIFVRSKLSEECWMIQEECGSEQALVFCANISHAQEVASYLPSTGILASHKKPNENNWVLEQFKNGEIQFLLSIDKLIEGVDLPSVKYGFSLRSTASPTVIWQQIGRVLRRSEGKEKAVFVDFVGNFEKMEELKSLEDQIQAKVTESKNKSDSDDDTIRYLNSIINFTWTNEVRELYDLIQKQEPYSTLPECQEAWANLVKTYGLENTLKSYRKNHFLDPKLPSWPTIKNRFNISFWNEFKPNLGNEKYPTLPECQEAWANLAKTYGLENTLKSYKDNYSLDPKLPGWGAIKNWFNVSSWKEFLGQEQYSTLPECQEAWAYLVSTYGLDNTYSSYTKNHFLDPKLPSWPTVKNRFNVSSWKEFLGQEQYSTLPECQEAWAYLVKTHGLKNTFRSYEDNYSLDPKLPSWQAIKNRFNISSWSQFKPNV